MIVSIRYVFFASFLIVAGVAFAKAKDVDIRLLKHGMDKNDVLTAIGAPLEKQEFETKHEELWIYKNTEISFKEGQLNLPNTITKKNNKVDDKEEDDDEFLEESSSHSNLEDWGAVSPIKDDVQLKDILKGMTKYIDDGKKKKDEKGRVNARMMRR